MANAQTLDAIPEWTLGWRMRRALAAGDVSVNEMAEHIGYSRSQISRWLNDREDQAPRRSVIRLWALRCGVPFDWLLNGETPDPDPDDGTKDEGQINEKSSFVCTRSPSLTLVAA